MIHKGNDFLGTLLSTVSTGNAKYSWNSKAPAVVPSLALMVFDLAPVTINLQMSLLVFGVGHEQNDPKQRALDSSIFPQDISFGQGLPEFNWVLMIKVMQRDQGHGPHGVMELLNGGWFLPYFLAMYCTELVQPMSVLQDILNSGEQI